MAKEVGISRAEIETVQSIVMAVSAGRVRAQFREARQRAAATAARRAGTDPGTPGSSAGSGAPDGTVR